MGKIPMIVALSMLGIFFFNKLFFTPVPLGKIGIKINKWGGIVDEDYNVGYHFSVIGIHEWKLVDKSTKILNFSQATDEGESLIVRTKDNNEVYIDVSIPYRIIEGKGNLIISGGLEKTYVDRMKLIAKSILRAELAQLSPANIIQTDIREEITKNTLPLLNEKLKEIHLVADGILIRGFSFTNDKVEKTIQEKQYLIQEKLLKEAQIRENKAQLETNKLETEIVNAEKKETEDWNKKIQELESEYKIKLTELNAQKITYDKKVRAEGDAQKDILFAEGNLALSKAEALKIKLESDVLRSRGGQIFIAKQAAENLNITKIKLNSNMRNPLDFISLKNMLKLIQP